MEHVPLPAEQIIVASLFLSPPLLTPSALRERLVPGDMDDEECRTVFVQAIELEMNGKPVDLVTLDEKRGGTLPEWLVIAMGDAVLSKNKLDAYIDMIAERASLRMAHARAENVRHLTENRQPEDAASELRSALEALERPASFKQRIAPVPAIDRARLISYEDLWKKSFPPQTYLVDKMICDAQPTMIFGAAGAHKTDLFLSASVQALEGQGAWGHFPTSPMPVLYVDAENGERELQKKLHRMCSKGSVPIHFYDGMGDQLTEAYAAQLLKLAKELKVKMIVFDPVREFLLGDENKSEVVAAFFRTLAPFFRENIGVTLIHHNPLENPMTGATQKRPRGSSVFITRCYSLVYVEFNQQSQVITVEQTKNKGDLPVPTFQVDVKQRDGGGGFDLLYRGEAPQDDAHRAAIQTAIMDFLAEAKTPVTTQAIQSDLLVRLPGQQVTPRTIYRHLKELNDEGVITRVPHSTGKSRIFLYQIVDGLTDDVSIEEVLQGGLL